MLYEVITDRARLYLPRDPLTRLDGVVVAIDTARAGRNNFV